MTAEEKGLATFKEFVAENPHTGTAEQVVTLSMGIAAAADRLSPTTLSIYRDASTLGKKVFSKLKVIGNQLGQLDNQTRREVTQGLPASYSTIHLLCALKPDELAAAVKTKQVTPKTSVRAANNLRQTSPLSLVSRWAGKTWRKDVGASRKRPCIGSAAHKTDHWAKTCNGSWRRTYGRSALAMGWTSIRATNESTTALRDAERKEKAAFWREVLEEQLTPEVVSRDRQGGQEDLQRQGRRGGLGRTTTHLHWIPHQDGQGEAALL